MVSLLEPITWVKIGLNLDGNIEDILKMHGDFVPTVSPLGNTKQFMWYDGLGLITLSKGYEVVPQYNYNIIGTFTSQNENTNLEMVRSFEKDTGIILRPAPKHLKTPFRREIYSRVYTMFLDGKGEEVLEIAKRQPLQ